MLGRDVVSLLEAEGESVIALSRRELDVSDRDAVLTAVASSAPDVIVNCAAWTKVDDAEAHEAQATLINGAAVENLAAAANRSDALLIQPSTDFVFDGASREPYEVDAETAPLSAYGRSKLAGEVAAGTANRHVILRTAWLFGLHGWNFVEAMRKQIESGRYELRVVDDQRGRPTYTPHLARAIVALGRVAAADEKQRGTFHYADSPECTWFDFATEIVEQLKLRGVAPQDARVLPVSSAEFPRPAIRPAYSVLSTRRYEEATGLRPSSWKDGLREYLTLPRPAKRGEGGAQ